ncbi:P-II family nitrogen regulator [bacterium]|nr:P-II family nitrogen regulator [bacterium]
MKKVVVVFRKKALNDFLGFLKKKDIKGATIYKVKGFGRQFGYKELQKSNSFKINLLDKMKAEMLLPDKNLVDFIDELQELLQTGRMGDGKIWIEPIEDVIRVRTGESGEGAIS